MSSFMCEKCRVVISDSPNGYTTGCEHYPMYIKGTDEAWEERKLGNDERYVAPYVDTNTRLAQQEYRIEQLEDELTATKTRLTTCDEMLQREWQEHQETKAEVQEQARLLGISGSREAKLLAERDRLMVEIQDVIREKEALKVALELIYDRYEEGVGCYEDPEESAGYVGNAVRLSYDEENKIIALLPSDAARGEK